MAGKRRLRAEPLHDSDSAAFDWNMHVRNKIAATPGSTNGPVRPQGLLAYLIPYLPHP